MFQYANAWPESPARTSAARSLLFRLSRPLVWLLLAILLAFAGLTPGTAAAEDSQAAKTEQAESLLPLVGGALVEVGAGHWDRAAAELSDFGTAWSNLDPAPSGDAASGISAALEEAVKAIELQEADRAKQQLSALAKQVHQWMSDNSERTDAAASGKKAALQLREMADRTLEAINRDDLAEAQNRYKAITDGWGQMEGAIRSGNFGVYSKAETHMSLVRVALQAQPPKPEQAAEQLHSLSALLQNYIDGRLDEAAQGETGSLADALGLLREAGNAIDAGNAETAAGKIEEFIVLWPAVEGEVSISSASVYASTENRMTEAQSYLLSNPPDLAQAGRVIGQMLADLEPVTAKTSYSAWDAALVLLREGLEALLVLAALLAFAKRANQSAARCWIWAGAGTGLVLSAGLALALTYLIAKAASGSTRELFEGIIGLVAVVMMLAVGHFLHGKSNAQAWNDYIAKQVGGALRRGSLWSLFALSGLAILREGAETAVFYIGMAPSIEPGQLLTGMLGASAALAILGYVVIRFSVKLPIKPFMLIASLFIYYLVIRFLGESLHALQVAGLLPVHRAAWLPEAGWLGAYPTWETFAPQGLFLLFIVARLTVTEYRGKRSALPM
ncbi:MAG: FTR1 family protein [Paenibacillus sp.]|uniref:FTR1 family iron permease n=1 Tax=Paenibacillus sp. TaxID=58172 RepID=UPI00290427E6|nr:FTR1 family protein [Paenibacillus sp.]MDU2241379.1 FTR1 family protein [Paenibacillus sp.]